MAKLKMTNNAGTTTFAEDAYDDALVTAIRTRMGFATNAEAAEWFLRTVRLHIRGFLKSQFIQQDIRDTKLAADAAFDALMPE
jgi:DNA-directed RNA polymerase specialized sigma24 family protein